MAQSSGADDGTLGVRSGDREMYDVSIVLLRAKILKCHFVSLTQGSPEQTHDDDA